MKIGVFVGSFDPVHVGHTNVINYLIDKNVVDKVMVIATGNYWNKQNVTDLKVRLKMLEFIKNDNVIIDNKHNGLSYTYQILDALEREYKNDEFYLIIGADNANTLDKWMKHEELMKRPIIVVARDDIKIKLKGDNVIIINENFGNVSSTKIRNDVDGHKGYLNRDIYNWIKKNNMYDLKWRRRHMLESLVEKLTKSGKTIATMESCTGGGVVNAITNVPGASEVLKFSAVTYCNEYKIKMGVSKEVIDKYTVYSMQTADEMSKNISLFTNADYGVGITGKLNRVDKNNPYGNDNVVYVSVYDKANNKFYNQELRVTKSSRKDNKELVIESVIKLVNSLL